MFSVFKSVVPAEGAYFFLAGGQMILVREDVWEHAVPPLTAFIGSFLSHLSCVSLPNASQIAQPEVRLGASRRGVDTH